MMWGAKVKTPVDMPDDVLKDAITITSKEISGSSSFEAESAFSLFLNLKFLLCTSSYILNLLSYYINCVNLFKIKALMPSRK